MQTVEFTNLALEEQIKALNEALNEIRINQLEELKIIKKNHAIYMKKMDKFQEYDKIADITNQVFEKRLLAIEEAIKTINKNFCA